MVPPPVADRHGPLRHRKLQAGRGNPVPPRLGRRLPVLPSPALGPKGEVCVSRVRSFPFTFSVFRRNGVCFSAGINEELPNQGAKISRFSLARSVCLTRRLVSAGRKLSWATGLAGPLDRLVESFPIRMARGRAIGNA